MKTSVRQSCGFLLALALLLQVGGCSTTGAVRTHRDDTVDFSEYRSWSWLPGEHRDDSPRDGGAHVLSTLVLEQVHRELSGRGFHYQHDDADLGVTARLTVTRERHVTHLSSAVESLHSFHDSPSFEIQTTEQEFVDYERGHLLIRVFDRRRNREVWRGEYENRHRDSFTAHARTAVANTLGSFPATQTTDAVFDPSKVAKRR
jgi:hypothetical protein